MKEKKIKVAHVVLNLDIGGLETMVVDMIRHMDRDRFEVVTICLRNKGVLGSQIEEMGFKVYCLNGGDRLEWKAFFQLTGILKKEKIDVVHAHNNAAYIYAGVAAMLSGFKKVIYTEHGRIFPDSIRHMMAEKILSWFTVRIVTVSEDMQECLIKYEKINPAKIQVIHNGIDTEKFRKIDDGKWRRERRKTLGIGEKDIVIGNVARLDPVKDHGTLIQAFALFKRKMEDGEWKREKAVKLLIVGDGSELENLKNLCNELSVNFFDTRFFDPLSILHHPYSIIFTGSRTDIMELMNLMDVFVLSSKNEGISLTLLGAMACGLPVVATNVGGNPEIIRHGENGLLCQPEDVSGMADNILEILRRPVANHALSAMFTLKSMIKQYELLYEQK